MPEETLGFTLWDVRRDYPSGSRPRQVNTIGLT